MTGVTGGKFANGAVTAAMAYAFNQLVASGWEQHKASATREGRSRAEPHLSHWDGVKGAHRYENGATLLCVLASEGCSVGIMEQLYGPISAPFAEPYAGPGRGYTLLGNNPIDHERPAPGILVNTTVDGHRFHPGDVVHAIYEHLGCSMALHPRSRCWRNVIFHWTHAYIRERHTWPCVVQSVPYPSNYTC